MSGLSARTYSCDGDSSRTGSGVASRGGAGDARRAPLVVNESLPFLSFSVFGSGGLSSSLDNGGVVSVEDKPEDDIFVPRSGQETKRCVVRI